MTTLPPDGQISKTDHRIMIDNPRYVIYNDGRVYSVKHKMFVKSRANDRGYLRVYISKGKRGYGNHVKVHRLVALHFVENPNKYKEVNHKDGNKLNNHYSNLEWTTRSANIKHAIDNKLLISVHSENHGMAKLTNIQAKAIKEDLKNGIKPKEIAKTYNIGITSIYHIKTGRQWKHV